MNMHTSEAFTMSPAVGMPADPPGSSGVAYVVAVEPVGEGEPQTYTLGAGMRANRLKVILASRGGYLSEPLSEHIVSPMLYRAKGSPAITAEEAAEIYEAAKVAKAAWREEAARKIAEADTAREQAARDLERYQPAWAKAAIVAELVHDQSDSMSDYFGHTTTRRIVLAWSSHTRDLFPEMRKAAALFAETAELATAPADAEHREKYSMGGGFYLKAGYRHSDGWRVSKTSGRWIACPGLEFTPEARGEVQPSAAPPSMAAGRFTISHHIHSRKGFDMWICQLAERVERAEYDALLAAARPLGGWYSRPWGGTPGGFAFKQESAARQFAADHGGAPEPDGGPGGGEPLPQPRASGSPKPAAPVKSSAGMGDKLRSWADALQPRIDDCFRDRLANTPKRARQAGEKRNEGGELERAQRMFRALAERYDAGDVPADLADVTTKHELLRYAGEHIERNGGYYDAGTPTGRPVPYRDAGEAAKAAALWGLLDDAGEVERRKAADLARKVEALRFASIPGYFPTPAAVVARMVEAAQLRGDDTGERVLEPSAGSGAIADMVRRHGCAVECVEHWHSLAEVLELKGHKVERADFLTMTAPADPHDGFDAVLMNPPFEKGQDCAHLRHAWGFVKPGGALVAVMGAGLTFRQGNPYAATRDFIEEHDGEVIELPAGAFKESGTGVASVMVTLWKPL